MKFFISVDVEGISGIVDGSMVSRKQGDYERGRKLMTADTNAAIKGKLSAHPDAEITVCHAHGSMNNIDPAVSTGGGGYTHQKRKHGSLTGRSPKTSPFRSNQIQKRTYNPANHHKNAAHNPRSLSTKRI